MLFFWVDGIEILCAEGLNMNCLWGFYGIRETFG